METRQVLGSLGKSWQVLASGTLQGTHPLMCVEKDACMIGKIFSPTSKSIQNLLNV
jgi:hypothetical protein